MQNTNGSDGEERMAVLTSVWESIIDEAGCPVVVTDAKAQDNPIIFVNSRFEELSGYEKKEVIGQNPRILHAWDKDQPGLAEMSKAIFERRPTRVAIRDYNKSGKPYWIEAAVSPVLDEQGTPTHFIGIQQDITKRVAESSKREEFVSELAREISQHEARARMIIDQALDAFISLDDNGRVIDWNDRAELLFGWNRHDVLEKEFVSLFIPEKSQSEFRDRWLSQYALHTQAGERCELTIVNRYGRKIAAEMSIFPIEFHQQRTYCAFVQDITTRKDAEQKVKEFYALVSHELRTPLTCIRGALGLIEGGLVGEIPPEAADMVKLARESSDKLGNLVNDILDLKKIETGKFELQIEQLDLSLLLKESGQALNCMAQQYGVSLLCEGSQTGAFVRADRLRLLQILANLISNGIKYSPEGAVLKVELVKTAGYWRIEVKDRGPGITPENLSKLFDKFKQLENSDNKPRSGTGLGLAIAKSLVEQHGGHIGVYSKVGEGSTFWFDMPAVAQSSQPSNIEKSAKTTKLGSPR